MASSLTPPYSILVPLFLYILVHSPSLTTAIHHSNETDRLALLAIKAQITHDPHKILASWNDSVHFCSWHGVKCSHLHQRVATLNLSSLSLSGTLSPRISNLTFLAGLNLELNSFHGGIPPDIGRLFRLRHLNLTNNSFSGEIPANLSGCANLEVVRLGWNMLTGSVPAQLGMLRKVERFQLHYNSFSGKIPESFGNLSSVKSLSLAVNNFHGRIPAALGNLKTLNFLGLGVNQFYGEIPHAIFNLSSLVVLTVPYNKFEGTLPSDLGFTLPRLQVLNVGNNLLTGPLPVSLSNASNLVEFDATGSRFTGKVLIDFRSLSNLWWLILASNPLGEGEFGDLEFLDSLTNSRNLKVLDLSNCRFGGALPHSVANLSTNLLLLRLGGNEISGSISVGFENLVNLTGLQLQKNKFSGRIPAELGNLSNLQLLDLSENKFSGHIPSSLSKLTRLFLLNLNNNHLNGSIPLIFGDFQLLQQLDLSHNNLSGEIPRNLMSVSSLTLSLNLAHNLLSGSLPSEVGELKNLESLNVSENRLSGEIPVSLGGCVTLQRLDMAGNAFEGPIPSSFLYLRGLEYLNLSINNLSGSIPGFLQRLPLKNLNLSFNELEGEIPTEGVFRNASAFSVAGNDKLCGGVPELARATCLKNEPKKRKSDHGLALMIPLLCGVVALVLIFSLIIACCLRRRRREPQTSSPSEITMFSKITYGDLHKATDGFSSANLLGSGGSGSVYRGTLESERKIVAVKVFRLHSRGSMKSFMAECRALRNIKHRNLVKIHTACSSTDHSGSEFKALVYEFMPNGSLERWIHGSSNENQRSLGLLERLIIAIDVASALDYLHHHCHRTIIHSDLKPSNILLDDDMTAHVGDFGLSRLIPDVSNPPSSSDVGIRGTIGYAAPEYGMGSNCSPEGDVYSFGVVLLEMFTGRRPTDSAFVDGLDLHNTVSAALPERVDEVLDPMIVQECKSVAESEADQERECLISIMRIGVACSMQSPKDRMEIADVVKELELIKDILLAFSAIQCSSTSGSLRFEGSSSRSAAYNWQNVL
ncbi:hypothetical protein C2S52_022774 [Perilla frutescens var. hirtella]|nr:hypothetical protein C2S52_022774 [Perilla frutescens var. hirtella]